MSTVLKPRILVAGAGIGGLAVARLLAQRGFDVMVCEQASRFAEIGAGVQLSTNAMKVLRVLGLEADITACAFAPDAFAGWDWKSVYRDLEQLIDLPRATYMKSLSRAGRHEFASRALNRTHPLRRHHRQVRQATNFVVEDRGD